jgi:glutamate-1-semialdehyde 2,1-aminomutase
VVLYFLLEENKYKYMIFNENYNNPLRASDAKNQFIKINDHWCLDTSMGAGTHLFGHHKIRTKNDLFIFPNKYVDEASNLLCAVSGMSHVVWCNTGTEAVMRALRIARAYTNRNKIAMFLGGWHGTSDNTLIGISKGIPETFNDLLITLQFKDSDFIHIAERDLAAVIVEPIQASLPIDRSEYLAKLQVACKASGTVLIFDELISGFRCGIGGAIKYYKITPDIVCYGKILGGGLPIGVVCGGDVMEIIRTGPVRMGGTFSGNPASMESCNHVLKQLLKKNIYEHLFNTVHNLSIHSQNYQIMTLAGMARVIYTGKNIQSLADRDSFEIPKDQQEKIHAKALDLGIYLNSNNCIMLSTFHTLSDINKIKKVLNVITKS